MELSSHKIKTFLPSPASKFFPNKNFLYFFLKKPALKKFLIFSQKNEILYFRK